ncbi:MAG: cupin domain-containing protein [Dehalococcoidales bacterium]|nr:cupin domain-containing protein [Dehalococcoidales bacterium]
MEGKYARYIMTDVDKNYLASLKVPDYIEEQRRRGNYMESFYMFHLDSNILPGGFYTDCHWILSIKGNGGLQTELAHAHDFNETLGFVGSNPYDPRSLGGEIEFWLEDERYIIDKSCLIFVPAGMKHLPLIFRRVDRPFFFWTASDSPRYSRVPEPEQKKQ